MAGHNHRSAVPKLGRRTLKGIMMSVYRETSPKTPAAREKLLDEFRWALEEVVALHEKAELEMQDLARKKAQLVSAIARAENWRPGVGP